MLPRAATDVAVGDSSSSRRPTRILLHAPMRPVRFRPPGRNVLSASAPGSTPRLLSFRPAPWRLAQRLAPGCPRMCHMTVPNPGAFAQAAVPPGASFLTLRWLQAPSSGPPARVLCCLPPQRQDQRVAFASEPVSPANLCSAQGRGPHLTPAGLPAQGTAGAGYTVRLRKSRDGGSPLAVSPPFCS